MKRFLKSGLRCILALAVVYGAWWIWNVEDNMVFNPTFARIPNPVHALPLAPYREEVIEGWIKTADNFRLYSWYVPARDGKPTVILVHGNGGNMGVRWAMPTPFIKAGYGILLFDYRGYGISEGNPSEKGLYTDLEAVSDYLIAKGVPVSEQIVHGCSLGGGPTVEIATRRQFKAVVLDSTFTGIPEIADEYARAGRLGPLALLPRKMIVRPRFMSLQKIPRVTEPLLVVHNEGDPLIPAVMGKTLFEQAGAHHKKLYIGKAKVHGVYSTEIVPQLNAFLHEVEMQKRKAPKAG